MKKIFVCIFLVLCLLLTGCDTTKNTKESTFVLVEKGHYYSIVYHRETKVMYAISDAPYNRGGFTVMVDANGKPLIYQENESDARS